MFRSKFKNCKSLIFFETFDNKICISASNSVPEKLKDKVFTILNKSLERYVYVDIDHLFNQMNIKPNYKLFYSNPYYKESKIDVFDNCFKINFYSSVRI